jgi:phosphate transport system substrate-binding protein
MKPLTGRLRLVVVAGTIVTVAAAASVAAAQIVPLAKLNGTITADGSSTVGPYTTAAAELFSRAGARNVRITVGISGTGGGFERFCKGETDLSDASRPISASEVGECRKNDVVFRPFVVANDALTVVVNAENSWAKCLSVRELSKIWSPGSKVDSWNDVRAGFPDEPIKLFGPGTDSGTFDYFTGAVNGDEGRSRSDYAASEDDNVLVTGVAGERGGLGYFGFSYFEQNRDRLKAVSIRNPKTGRCVAPSKANVWNGSYRPLARPLYVYAKGSSFKRPEVQSFLRFVFNNERAIAKRSQFIALTKQQLAQARATFSRAVRAANRT